MPDPFPPVASGNNQGQRSALTHEQSLHCASPLVQQRAVWLCCLCSKMRAAQQPNTGTLVMLYYLVEGEQRPEEPALIAEQSLRSYPSSPIVHLFWQTAEPNDLYF